MFRLNLHWGFCCCSGACKTEQLAGTIVDLNGDGIQDLLAVDVDGEVWVLFGGGVSRALGVTLAASKARGPVTVTVSDAKRRTGMYVVKPGVPVFIGRP